MSSFSNLASTVGTSDGSYFVGRRELIEWINSCLGITISKIEETASGVVACLIMDKLFPGSIPMKKLNQDARYDYQFIDNYKLLQTAFEKQGIPKRIEVQKLIKGKYQDNLEFMQWLRGFFEKHNGANSQPSNPKFGHIGSMGLSESKPNSESSENSCPNRGKSGIPPVSSNNSKPREYSIQKGHEESGNKFVPESRTLGAQSARGSQDYEEDSARIKEIENDLHKIKVENAKEKIRIEDLAEERDFYYQRLAEIEEYAEERLAEEDSDLLKKILEILNLETGCAPEAEKRNFQGTGEAMDSTNPHTRGDTVEPVNSDECERSGPDDPFENEPPPDVDDSVTF